ncbi:hypothetical protein BC830DRAFT_1100563 [Chytriomyces sp. MP71]|nr:hypothetical protein BC830DRAFT_1100563 [Chytriomyces sp. MP71]
MNPTHAAPIAEPLRDQDLLDVLHHDSAVYPTDSPLSLEVLADWIQAAPQFAFRFQARSGQRYDEPSSAPAMGLFVAVALTTDAWRSFIAGNLREADLHTEALFPALSHHETSAVREYALHVYHIHKTAAWDAATSARMGPTVKAELLRRVAELEACGDRLVGVSGLAVTDAGIALMANVFECVLLEGVVDEVVVENARHLDTDRKVVSTAEGDRLLALDEDWRVVSRPQMMVRHGSL